MRYTVPTHYLKKSPYLSSQLSLGRRTVKVSELDEDIGHTLVHFLYTNKYQTLKRPAISNAENRATEYKRSVLVYQAASAYKLPLLLKRAKQQIGNFNDAVSIFEVLDVAELVYEKLQNGDEVWFYDYLRQNFANAFDADETLFAQEGFRQYIGTAPRFSRMLVKLMEEIFSDRLSKARIKNDQPGACNAEKPTCNGELVENRPVLDYPEPELEEDGTPKSDSSSENSPSVEVAWHGTKQLESPVEEVIPDELEPVPYIDEAQPAVTLSAVPDEYDSWDYRG